MYSPTAAEMQILTFLSKQTKNTVSIQELLAHFSNTSFARRAIEGCCAKGFAVQTESMLRLTETGAQCT